MKTLTIYSTPNCSHCRDAKKYLTGLEVPFTDVNLHEDAAAMDFMRSRGHRSVPQIYLEDQQFVAGWHELSGMSKETILERLS